TNRVQNGIVKRVEVDVCDRLKHAAEKDCPAAQKSLADLRAAIEAKDAAQARKLFDQAREDYDTYHKELFNVLDAMQKMQGIKEIIRILEALLHKETQQVERIEKVRAQ